MTATVAGWITYAAARGTTIADNSASQQALVRASDYIRSRYTIRRPYLDPDLVEEATYIAAASELETPGFWSKIYTPNQQKVLTKVEGISWTVVGGDGRAEPVSTLIDGLLGIGERTIPVRALGT